MKRRSSCGLCRGGFLSIKLNLKRVGESDLGGDKGLES